MSQTRNLLLIDDELTPGQDKPSGSYMWYYSEALREEGFQITEAADVDEALRELATDGLRFDLIVLDVMMPPGKAFAGANTQDGLRTGILLADQIREYCPATPVVVLTQFKHLATWQQLRSKPKFSVVSKRHCTPFAFVKEVKDILSV
jgi:CheY-like chemotaxis protein